MYFSPVQILVKYLTNFSNCAFLCVDSSKKNFGPIHGTVFFPQGLKVSALGGIHKPRGQVGGGRGSLNCPCQSTRGEGGQGHGSHRLNYSF